MPKTIDITQGVQTFDDRLDTSRGNPDRKPFGAKGTDQFHMGSEYDVEQSVSPANDPGPDASVTPTPVLQKFTHKLSNGTTLEADSVEALAALIEKSFQQQAPVEDLKFDDRPLYTPLEFKRKELTLQEQADLLNLWKEKPQEAMRKLQEAEYGASMDVILMNLTRAELRELNRRQLEAEAEFMGECEDYNPTPANGKKMLAFLEENKVPRTKHNLVVAFRKLSASDPSLIRQPETPTAEPEPGEEVPKPPTHVPTNQGRQETLPDQSGDKFALEFAGWPLAKQQEWFAKKRRENRG
jgi:hypothetical protein